MVGFRPSVGRVPTWPNPSGWFTLAVEGPMARTVEDVALVMRAIAGPDPRCPLSLPEGGETFCGPLERDFKGVRVAWSPDLGELPVDPMVIRTLEPQLRVFESLGCTVEQASPEFSGADETFKVWRAWRFELGLGELLNEHKDKMKESVVWNIEEGRRLTGPDIGRAEKLRTALYEKVAGFMEEYEFLILPVSQVPPFDIHKEYVEEIDGVPMDTYLDWMRSCYYISVVGLPAISVPAGFTQEGLPVGMQIVGRPLADLSVLQLAYAFQGQTNFWRKRPHLAAP